MHAKCQFRQGMKGLGEAKRNRRLRDHEYITDYGRREVRTGKELREDNLSRQWLLPSVKDH